MHRILSIQSHVVHGYVGNKCAVFPLQLLGFEVDNINSVQLSNHTGYKHIKGQVLNSTELQDLVEGLKLNDLHHYSHILTGYVGSTSFLSKVVDTIRELKAVSPNLVYVCDPVLGDNGKMYVPKDNLEVYVNQLIPLADIMTPNQYEAEWLSGIKIVDERSAVDAMNWFHGKGVKVIVITSTNVAQETKAGTISGFASQNDFKRGQKEQLVFYIPLLKGQFTGVGDLFSAVFTAWMAKTDNLKISCEKTFSTLQHVMKRTLSTAQPDYGNDPLSMRSMELQLISSKHVIEDPEIVITAGVLEMS